MGEEQQGFRRGRDKGDRMSSLRQLGENTLEGQDDMALGFVDIEEACDTVPRETAMAKLRWMGIPKEEVKTAEDTKEEIQVRIVSGTGISGDFRADFDLKQGVRQAGQRVRGTSSAS